VFNFNPLVTDVATKCSIEMREFSLRTTER